MAQSNEFRALMSTVLEAWPKQMITPQLRSALQKYATAHDALATRADENGSPANTQSGAGGSGGAAASGQKASAASHVALAKVPRYLSTGTTLDNEHPMMTPSTAIVTGGMAQADRQDSHMDGYPSRIAMIASGQNVQPGDAIFIENGKAYVAGASAGVNRRCNAMAVRGTGEIGEIVYTRGGTALGRLAGSTGTTGVLYLSTTPGKLTFDDSEADKAFTQEVGFYDVWLEPQLGDASPTMFEFAFFPFPPYSFS